MKEKKKTTSGLRVKVTETIKKRFGRLGYDVQIQVLNGCGDKGIADLKDYRLHDLRHTYASFAVSGGFSLPIIAKMLGHADIKTTERYAHLHQDPINQAIDDVSLKIKKVMEL